MSWVDQLAPWKPPRLQKALQANAAHHSHHESFAVLRTKPSDMNEFGVGTTLYFEWLRQMTAFFVSARPPADPPDAASGLRGLTRPGDASCRWSSPSRPPPRCCCTPTGTA